MKNITKYTLSTFLLFTSYLYPIEKESISCLLIGGFGNTLEQFAAAYTHARHKNIPLYLNQSEKGPINLVLKNRFSFVSKSAIKHHKETPSKGKIPYCLNYSNYLINESNICYRGNFLGEKWFRNYKEEIINIFQSPKNIKDQIEKKYKYLLSQKNTVGIHIRTWYPDEKLSGQPTGRNSLWSHLIPTREYLKNAISKFSKDSTFIVCSDCISKAKKLLKGLCENIFFINDDNNNSIIKFTNKHQDLMLEDFYLLTFCDHNIITAGTFGWWAAYLNQNPNKIIICPNWTVANKRRNKEDQYPKRWVTLDMSYYK